MGCQLFAAAAPPKRFIVLTGGHNDSAWTDNYRQAVREFVDETLSSATNKYAFCALCVGNLGEKL